VPNYQIYQDNTSTNGAVAVSSTNTYYSDAFAARDGRAVSFHLVWTGTPTGTFTLWYSNKPNADASSDSDWVQDTTFSPTNPAGSASKGFYTVGNLCAERIRVKYVNASGSGTLIGWAQVAVKG
jgi:hypothetical protein